ncbi:MAG: protein kinase, partial [Bryobacteraceae bacterium]|nr:protein kinase [Bryobacteraceae bacterium]
YKVHDVLGHGGMGTVYRAVRDDDQFEQEVAIKLVRHGLDSDFVRGRFLYERQILAFLNHPYIARLLDGGTTKEGWPYLVMEFVEGQPIDEYLRAKNPALPARLNLFLKVCTAVEHAHRNLIVHRDLKPTNILITADGSPKLLDFGIAKLLLPEHPTLAPTQTTIQFRALTPEYASPEQVKGLPISTAADVYSLGVLLYELLTGQKAHRFTNHSPAEIENVVCLTEPPRPSTLTPALAGDLDNIIAKAIEKNPTERYASVEQFADDIQRYLVGRPVRARSATLFYLAGKFVRRNRTLVLGLAAVALSLIAGIIATSYQARIAERRYQDIRKIANALIVEHDVFATLPGSTAQRAKLVEQSLVYLDNLNREVGDDDPELRRELAVAFEKMGDVQGRADAPNLGKTPEAIASYTKSIAIRESLLAAAPQDQALRRDLSRTFIRLSGALKIKGDLPAALAFERKALAMREALLRENPADVSHQRLLAESFQALGLTLYESGDEPGAWQMRQQALERYQQIVARGASTPDDYRGLSLAHVRLGAVLARRNQNDDALHHYGRAIDVAREGVRSHPRNVALQIAETVALRAQSGVLLTQKRWKDAVPPLRESIRVYQQIVSADPDDVRTLSMLAATRHRLGQAFLGQMDRAAALDEIRQALRLREELSLRDPANAGAQGEVAESLALLGRTLGLMGRRTEAIDTLKHGERILVDLASSGRANIQSRERLEMLRQDLKFLEQGRPLPE